MFCKICSGIHKLQLSEALIVRINRNLSQTHYEVLKVDRNCSDKEIKEAFIKLSKEHHPDINKSSTSHARFLQIHEAYKTLGKTESRRNYDLGLTISTAEKAAQTHSNNHYNPSTDPAFWSGRDKSHDKYYKKKPYYGIHGINRVSNVTIVIVCLAMASIGVGLQFLAITKSFTLHRAELIRKSIEAQKSYEQSRRAALDNDNELQVEILRIKLLGIDSNRTRKEE